MFKENRTDNKKIMRRLTDRISLFALVFFISVSFLWFGSLSSWTSRYMGHGNDPIIYMWCMNWWFFSIGKLINPLWTHYIWYPQGFDLAWATSMPFLAALAAPVIILKGSVFAFNLLTVISPGLSAWTAFLLFREISNDDFASIICGYLFGFSSYELGQMLGHLNLDAIFIIPIIMLLVFRRFNKSISRKFFILLTGIFIFFQIGIS